MPKLSTPMYAISWQKPEKLARLTWLGGTEGMTDEDFRETLEVFAEAGFQHRARRLVIDVREFKHRPSAEILAWRDSVTVRKYDKAGVQKLVWIWPGDVSNMNPSSAGGRYKERYFSMEEDAIAWVME